MKLHWNNNSSAMARLTGDAYFGASGIAPVARSVVISFDGETADTASPTVGQCMNFKLKQP